MVTSSRPLCGDRFIGAYTATGPSELTVYHSLSMISLLPVKDRLPYGNGT